MNRDKKCGQFLCLDNHENPWCSEMPPAGELVSQGRERSDFIVVIEGEKQKTISRASRAALWRRIRKNHCPGSQGFLTQQLL